jgi:hypothetical protein
MAQFRDNASGTVYTFLEHYDIEQMRKHPDYSEVIQSDQKQEKKKEQAVAQEE